MEIRTLPDFLINQIAAGEVVERPAFIVKELLENSLDANATEVEVYIKDAGKNEIVVSDNGIGMSINELKLCVKRHATSKLTEDNLSKIRYLGFRGEAIPSIASISNLKIESSKVGMNEGWGIILENNKIIDVFPSSRNIGTKITIKNVFKNVPARLKFLKSNNVENKHSLQIIKKLALSHPTVKFSFKFEENKINILNSVSNDLVGTRKRIFNIIDENFLNNSVSVDNTIFFAEKKIQLSGLISIPTFNKVNQTQQFLFVNGRPIQDRALSSVIRLSYKDTLPRGRHPVYCLFLKIPNEFVDVNVHPTKMEVRFQIYEFVKSFFIKSINYTLNLKNNKIISKEINLGLPSNSKNIENINNKMDFFNKLKAIPKLKDFEGLKVKGYENNTQKYSLGSALYQFNKNYIISITTTSILLIDQHAAHERIMFERMKKNIQDKKVERQILLIPITLSLVQAQFSILLRYQKLLKKLGFEIDEFGKNKVVIREIPSLLNNYDIKQIVIDLCDDLDELGFTKTYDEKINLILGNICCHRSIRSGRQLTLDEMNALLRDMENTPNSGQCNHGRPTSISLSIKEIEKLFERT